MRVLVVMLVGVLTLGGAREASACSCLEPLYGAGRFYPAAGGPLPLDAVGIPWTGPAALAEKDGRVTLERIQGERRVAVKFTIVDDEGISVIVPARKFKAGEVYAVTVRESEDGARARAAVAANGRELPPPEITAKFTISPAPLGLAEVQLRVDAHKQEGVTYIAPGICSAGLDAETLRFSVVLPPTLEPLRDYLRYETLVDGSSWTPRTGMCDSIDPGRSWEKGIGTDMLFSACTGEGLAAGEHKLEVRVRAPGAAQGITTPALAVTLACKAPAKASPAPAEPGPPPAEPAAPVQAEAPPEVAPRGCAVAGALPLPLWLVVLRRRRRA